VFCYKHPTYFGYMAETFLSAI